MTSGFILKVHKCKIFTTFSERALVIYFCIAEPKEISLKKELLLNQKMTFLFNVSFRIHLLFLKKNLT